MLVKLGSGLINTAAVVSVMSMASDPRTGAERRVVTLKGGTSFVTNMTDDEADRLLGAIVLAPQGYGLIQAHPPAAGEDEPTFSRATVLAFRASANACLPITLEGEPEGSWALVFPNGRCQAPWLGSYEDDAAFERDYRRSIAAQRDEP